MTPSRWSFGRPLVVGLLVVSPVVVSSSTLSDRSCAGLNAWAESYRGTRPTLEQFARLDRAERRALANVLTPAVLADLWREQLSRFSRRPDLSPEQQAFAHAAAGLVTPALYARDAAASETVDAFWRRAERAFSSPGHRRVFLDLGAVAETQAPPRTAAVLCGCNLTFPGEDCGHLRCVSTGCRYWTGCGVFSQRTCNGECQLPG